MADLTKDRATTKSAVTAYREQLVAKAAADTVYHIGLIKIIDDTDIAVNPAAANASLAGARAGVVKDFVDNTGGAAGAKEVELETGVFNFDLHGTNPPTLTGQLAYASDNHTISGTSTDGPLVGRVWKVYANSVDVNFGPLAN